MKSNQKISEEENTEEKKEPTPINYFTLNIEDKSTFSTPQLPSKSKNNENNEPKTTQKEEGNPPEKETQNNEYKAVNLSKNIKKVDNYSSSAKDNKQPGKSLQKEKKIKYLTLFNVNTGKYELSYTATLSSDGVLRGYTDNCSFYVSGSSDLPNKTQNQNSNNKNNFSNKENRIAQQNRIYESKTQVLNLNDYYKNNYRAPEILNYSANKISNRRNDENKFKRNNYSSKTNVYNSGFNLNTNYFDNNKTEEKLYVNDTYFDTEPNDNIVIYNHRKTTTDNYRQPLIPSSLNMTNKEPKATIKNINNNAISGDFKNSTKNNYEEKNKNLYKKINKGYEPLKRTNTPNISSRFHYNINERNTTPTINISQNRNTQNYVFYNGKYKISELENNFLNISHKYYQPKFTLNQRNTSTSGNNIINKNRYNFQVPPKKREYGTKTEVNSYNNKYTRTILNPNERGTVNEDTFKRNNQPFSSNSKKEQPKKKYETRSVSTASYGRGPRKYGILTETFGSFRNNYAKIPEYEVSDINVIKMQQKKGKLEPKDNIKNKKEFTIFEKSLKNIQDNEKEIEKDKTYLKYRDNINNHKIFVSSSVTKNKRVYKTSTQKTAFRPYGYNLGSFNEYEVPSEKNNKKDGNRRYDNTIKSNYFNAMKNLEEEIEVEDDNDQIEYLPPKNLNKINIKTNEKGKENKYKQPKDEKKTKINNNQKTNKIKIKNLNTNQNKNNIPDKKDSNNNTIKRRNHNYYESSDNKNKNKVKPNIIQKSYNDKRKNAKTIITNINKPLVETQKPKYQKYIPQQIHQIPSQYNNPIQINNRYKKNQIQGPVINQQNQQNQQKHIFTKKQNQQNKNQKPPQIEQKVNQSHHKQIQKIKIKPHLKSEKQKQKYTLQNTRKTEPLKEAHQEEVYNAENKKAEENNIDNVTRPKYGSYFGDSNNNYIEIKGVSSVKKEEIEEEDENEQNIDNDNDNNKKIKKYDNQMQLVRNVNFGIHSENLYVPGNTDNKKEEKEGEEKKDKKEDKEDKEADEQIMEEDEQNDDDNYNEEENDGEGQENEDEGDGDGEAEGEAEGDGEGEEELVGDEMIEEKEENTNEEYQEYQNENDEVNEDENAGIIEENEDLENNANEEGEMLDMKNNKNEEEEMNDLKNGKEEEEIVDMKNNTNEEEEEMVGNEDEYDKDK